MCQQGSEQKPLLASARNQTDAFDGEPPEGLNPGVILTPSSHVTTLLLEPSAQPRRNLRATR